MPAYTFAAHRQDLNVLRVVVRTGNVDLMDLLFDDLGWSRWVAEREPGQVRTGATTAALGRPTGIG